MSSRVAKVVGITVLIRLPSKEEFESTSDVLEPAQIAPPKPAAVLLSNTESTTLELQRPKTEIDPHAKALFSRKVEDKILTFDALARIEPPDRL